MSIQPAYSVGETVLCFHGKLLYKARCLAINLTDNGYLYFVHYFDWNENYETWVTDSRLLKVTEENVQQMEKLEQEHNVNENGIPPLVKLEGRVKKKSVPKKTATVKEKRSSQEQPADLKIKEIQTEPPEVKRAGTRWKRNINKNEVPIKKIKVEVLEDEPLPVAVPERVHVPELLPVDVPQPIPADVTSMEKGKTDADGKADSQMGKEKEKVGTKKGKVVAKLKKITQRVQVIRTGPLPIFNIVIPDHLNNWLKDDNHMIKMEKKILHLPARVTASDIIKEYQRLKKNTPKTVNKLYSAKCVGNGIGRYFNCILGIRLLFKFERIQYANVLKKLKKKNISLCNIYGAIHLLRMLADFEDFLHKQSSVLTNADLKYLQWALNDFISITKNIFIERLSLEDYETAVHQ